MRSGSGRTAGTEIAAYRLASLKRTPPHDVIARVDIELLLPKPESACAHPVIGRGWTPVILLGPATDDGEVDVAEREPLARQIRVAGHVCFHEEPPRAPDCPRPLAHRIDLVGVGRETLGIVVDLHDRVDLRRREEEPAKGLGTRRRPLRRQQRRLGVTIVEGEEDRDGLGQRRSIVHDEARDFAVGIDRGVLLTPLLIASKGKFAKLVVSPDLGEHALHRA